MPGLLLLNIWPEFPPPTRTLHTFISGEPKEPHCIQVSLFAGRNDLYIVTCLSVPCSAEITIHLFIVFA
jgi:hypothetical protein